MCYLHFLGRTIPLRNQPISTAKSPVLLPVSNVQTTRSGRKSRLTHQAQVARQAAQEKIQKDRQRFRAAAAPVDENVSSPNTTAVPEPRRARKQQQPAQGTSSSAGSRTSRRASGAAVPTGSGPQTIHTSTAVIHLTSNYGRPPLTLPNWRRDANANSSKPEDVPVDSSGSTSYSSNQSDELSEGVPATVDDFLGSISRAGAHLRNVSRLVTGGTGLKIIIPARTLAPEALTPDPPLLPSPKPPSPEPDPRSTLFPLPDFPLLEPSSPEPADPDPVSPILHSTEPPLSRPPSPSPSPLPSPPKSPSPKVREEQRDSHAATAAAAGFSSTMSVDNPTKLFTRLTESASVVFAPHFRSASVSGVSPEKQNVVSGLPAAQDEAAPTDPDVAADGGDDGESDEEGKRRSVSVSTSVSRGRSGQTTTGRHASVTVSSYRTRSRSALVEAAFAPVSHGTRAKRARLG